MTYHNRNLISHPVGESPRLRLSTPDDDPLYMDMVLRGALDTDHMTVIVHGRTGSGNGEISRAVGYALQDKGLSSLAVSLYSYSPDSRNHTDCTLRTNAEDIAKLNKTLRDRGTRVSAVAHSAGALGVLLSMQFGAEWDRVALVAPAHGLAWRPKYLSDPPASHQAVIDGREVIVNPAGEGYVESLAAYREQGSIGDTTGLVRAVPGISIVVAGADTLLRNYNIEYFNAAGDPRDITVIHGADHNFTEPRGALEQAAQAAARWVGGHMLEST